MSGHVFVQQIKKVNQSRFVTLMYVAALSFAFSFVRPAVGHVFDTLPQNLYSLIEEKGWLFLIEQFQHIWGLLSQV